MTAEDVVLVAVKSRVLAISKRGGHTLWESKLTGGISTDFVTLLADKTHVYAHTKGHLHCLSLHSGAILWANELPGCGYGIASIALPGGDATNHPGAVQTIANQQAAASGSSGGTSS